VVDEDASAPGFRGATVLIVAAVAPLLLTFLASAWTVVGWAAGTSPFWPDPQLTLSEAAGLGNAGEVVRLITLERKDPNRAWPVREGILGSAHPATPLEAALAGRRVALIPVLLRHGAVVPASDAARAWLRCLAADAGAPDVVEMLTNTGDASDPRSSCTPPSN
jgi:hypothetical protein